MVNSKPNCPSCRIKALEEKQNTLKLAKRLNTRNMNEVGGRNFEIAAKSIQSMKSTMKIVISFPYI